MTPHSTIDFAAEFGGRDAAAAVLPHFKALKAAAKGVKLVSFPFKELTFILRVDGEVTAYGLSGAGNIDFDRQGEYVSVDIGLTRNDWSLLRSTPESELIVQGITSSVDLLKASNEPRLATVDFGSLATKLSALCDNYRAALVAGHSR